MRYFCRNSDRSGTGYIEFFGGVFDPENGGLWGDGSLYIEDERFRESGLFRLFRGIKPGFDIYGCEVVDPEEWAEAERLAEKQGGAVAEAIGELRPWAENAIAEHGCFTVVGI